MVEQQQTRKLGDMVQGRPGGFQSAEKGVRGGEWGKER